MKRDPFIYGIIIGLLLLVSGGVIRASAPDRTMPADLVPQGFAASGLEERYGTPELKLENGSIFDYMDGGGIVYLEHGFSEISHREFTDAAGHRISLDIFTMDTATNALTALSDERISPAGGIPLAIEVTNKSYRFPPDYFIYLVHGQHLIYLHVNDDGLADTLNQFAGALLNAETEEKQ